MFIFFCWIFWISRLVDYTLQQSPVGCDSTSWTKTAPCATLVRNIKAGTGSQIPVKQWQNCIATRDLAGLLIPMCCRGQTNHQVLFNEDMATGQLVSLFIREMTYCETAWQLHWTVTEPVCQALTSIFKLPVKSGRWPPTFYVFLLIVWFPLIT